MYKKLANVLSRTNINKEWYDIIVNNRFEAYKERLTRLQEVNLFEIVKATGLLPYWRFLRKNNTSFLDESMRFANNTDSYKGRSKKDYANDVKKICDDYIASASKTERKELREIEAKYNRLNRVVQRQNEEPQDFTLKCRAYINEYVRTYLDDVLNKDMLESKSFLKRLDLEVEKLPLGGVATFSIIAYTKNTAKYKDFGMKYYSSTKDICTNLKNAYIFNQDTEWQGIQKQIRALEEKGFIAVNVPIKKFKRTEKVESVNIKDLETLKVTYFSYYDDYIKDLAYYCVTLGLLSDVGNLQSIYISDYPMQLKNIRLSLSSTFSAIRSSIVNFNHPVSLNGAISRVRSASKDMRFYGSLSDLLNSNPITADYFKKKCDSSEENYKAEIEEYIDISSFEQNCTSYKHSGKYKEFQKRVRGTDDISAYVDELYRKSGYNNSGKSPKKKAQ